MSAETTNRLVYMANQIARNLTHDADPVTAVADHMRAFWNPRMIDALVKLPNAGLDPVAAQALAQLVAKADAVSG